MVTYRKASPGEMPEILDFINMVFSMAHRPHDFRQLLPKLYEEGNEQKSVHYIAVEDGKIRAAMCVLPVTLCHKNSSIICGTVGSVSVHPYFRQKGYMRQLMNLAVSDMQKEGVSMSSLSGRRHRYQYYGYELGGYYYQYRFIPDNFRHCAGSFPQYHIRLERIENCQSPYLSQINQLMHEQTVFARREPDDFFTISKSWESELYAVLEGGHFQGYVSLNGNQIQELYLKNPALAFSCLQSCQEKTAGTELLLKAYPHQVSLIDDISGLHESCTIHIDDNYQIFNYREVLQFFLDVKSECCPLENGILEFTIQGHESIRIIAGDGKAEVTAFEKQTDLILSPSELISCMFSPEPGMRNRLLPNACRWFPLPMAMCPLDKC